MSNGSTMQTLVHLPRHPQRPNERPLPRGECRYIIPDTGANGKRQRCMCVSYSLNSSTPGSLCGCGHQAWHHMQEPAGEYVPLHEYRAILDKVRKLEDGAQRLQEDVVREREKRDKALADMQRAYYQNLFHIRLYVDEKLDKLKMHTDDKLESVEDKATEVESLRRQVSDMDEVVMRMEERLDNGKRLSRSLTPLMEGQASPSQTLLGKPASELPFRTDKFHRDSWDVRVVLIPSKNLPSAFRVDSVAWRRCQTRGLHQDLHLRDRSSSTFVQCTEACFMAIFRKRPWMPLQCLRSSDMSLCQLQDDVVHPAFWDYDFLESQCMAHDKLQGDVIYIALKDEDMSWEDIRALPCIFGSDESCWQHDAELDAVSKDQLALEDRMDTDVIKPRIVSDEYHSPPPYSSRASTHGSPIPRHISGRITALDVLATASVAESHRSAPSLSERSNYSAPSIISERSMSTIDSIESTLALAEADEHRSKRKRGIFTRTATGPQIPLQSAPVSPTENQIYYSGRVKRKINTKTKVREPMDWRTSEINFKSLLHRNDGKEKRNSGSGPSQSTTQPQVQAQLQQQQQPHPHQQQQYHQHQQQQHQQQQQQPPPLPHHLEPHAM